jgi:hypothetical protein
MCIKPLTKAALQKAICLKCDNCYAALALANLISGQRDEEWELCHSHSLSKLLEMAKSLGIDLNGLQTPVGHVPVVDSLYYKRVTKAITEEEFRAAFLSWKNGKT